MISRSRSRRRCKQSEALRSLSRSGRKHYKVYWTKLNGDNGSFQLPLTIGEFKAKLPSLAANSTYKVINGSIALKDSYYLAGADYHLSIIIVKQGAEPSNKAISDSTEELARAIIDIRRKQKLRRTTRKLMKHLRSVLDTSDVPAALEALSDARVEALRGFMVQKYFLRDFGLLLKPIQEAARLSATGMMEALDETERKLRGDDLLEVIDDTPRVS